MATGWISWTCWPCSGRVVPADSACPGCGAAFKPKPPYPEFCHHAEKCAASGRCEREICCAD